MLPLSSIRRVLMMPQRTVIALQGPQRAGCVRSRAVAMPTELHRLTVSYPARHLQMVSSSLEDMPEEKRLKLLAKLEKNSRRVLERQTTKTLTGEIEAGVRFPMRLARRIALTEPHSRRKFSRKFHRVD